MSERAERERVFVQIFGSRDHVLHEIAAPDVVREIAEQVAAKRIVAHILNDGAAVRIAMSLAEIVLRGAREMLQQQRLDRGVPGSVDNRLMAQDRVGLG